MAKFSFGDLMQREIEAEINAAIETSRKQVDEFKAEMGRKKAEIESTSNAYTIQVNSRLQNLDAAIEAKINAKVKALSEQATNVNTRVVILEEKRRRDEDRIREVIKIYNES